LRERAKVQENMAPKGQLQMQFAFAA